MKSFYHELRLLNAWGWVFVLALSSIAPGAPEEKPNSSETSPVIQKSEKVEEQVEAPAPSPALSNPSLSESTQSNVLKPSNSLGFNVRIDAAYSGGGSVYQGFSIPSIRLSGFGEVGKYLDYRLSVAQTREFSRSSLAQILPAEAYVVLSLNPNVTDTKTNLRLKAGLFSPSFNPVWTPDLSYLNIPDFNETHRALFLFREVGAEIHLEPFKKWLEIAVGAFNGTGIFAQNTNNSRALTAHLKLNIPFQKWTMSLGTGNYFLNQANVGEVGYKSITVSDLFLGVEIPDWNTQLYIDGFSSHFDHISGLNPVGGSAVLNLGLTSWLGLFGRYEYATESPVLSGCIRQFQLGPVIYFDPAVKSFVTYGELETGGSKERTMMIRLRLSV